MNYRCFKRSMAVVIALNLLLTAIPALAADAQPDAETLSIMALPPYFRADSVTGSPGEEVRCDVTVNSNLGFSFIELQVGFDPALLTPVELINGDIVAGFSNLSDPGGLPSDLSAVKYTWAGAADVFTSGKLFTVVFKIKDDAPAGTVELPITHSVMNQNFSEVFFQDQPGFVYIVDFIYGDVNGDGVVDIADSVLLLQYIGGWNVVLTEKQFAAADTFKDGVINAKDIVYLMQYVAGWNVELGTIPPNAPTPTPTPTVTWFATPTPTITIAPTPTTIIPTPTTIAPTPTTIIPSRGPSTTPTPMITGIWAY